MWFNRLSIAFWIALDSLLAEDRFGRGVFPFGGPSCARSDSVGVTHYAGN